MHYIPLSCTGSPCNLLFLNLGIYGLVQATVDVGTVLIWDFCVAYTRGGGVLWYSFVVQSPPPQGGNRHNIGGGITRGWEVRLGTRRTSAILAGVVDGHCGICFGGVCHALLLFKAHPVEADVVCHGCKARLETA